MRQPDLYQPIMAIQTFRRLSPARAQDVYGTCLREA